MFEVGRKCALSKSTSTSEITKMHRVLTFFACLFSDSLVICTFIYLFQDYHGIFFNNNHKTFTALLHERKVSVDGNFLDTSVENQSVEEYVENRASFTSNIRGNVTKHIIPMSGTNTSRILSTTYRPGNLIVRENGLLLSEGLRSRIIAITGQPVKYVSGQSSARFHVEPDAGATFTSGRGGTGWIYVSNSEFRSGNSGGVGAMTFNPNEDVIDYKMVLTNSRANCGGGKTPWGTWISCEEYDGGHIWQVDPSGRRTAGKITMGNVAPSLFESFAYDVRDKNNPKFFATKDHERGELRRFIPKDPNWNDPWNILFGAGTLDYLVLDSGLGKFHWNTDIAKGADSAQRHFPNAEGIDVRGNQMFFVAKGIKMLFRLNLDTQTYRSDSTNKGLFDGQPDILQRSTPSNEILYFTEDGGRYAGIHGRNTKGQYFAILEGASLSDETTGLAFSPNKKHMYVAYQDNGILFEITRADGQAFDGGTLDIKYHSVVR